MEKCPDCEREFETPEALQHHRTAKHAAATPKQGMKVKKSYVFAAVIIIIIAAGAYYFMTLPQPPGADDSFAQCLTEKGAVFYGTFWCPHCADQKKELGSSMKYVNYVECSTPDGQGQTQECASAGITSYPTWVFADGSRKTGTLPLSELASITNCTV